MNCSRSPYWPPSMKCRRFLGMPPLAADILNLITHTQHQHRYLPSQRAQASIPTPLQRVYTAQHSSALNPHLHSAASSCSRAAALLPAPLRGQPPAREDHPPTRRHHPPIAPSRASGRDRCHPSCSPSRLAPHHLPPHHLAPHHLPPARVAGLCQTRRRAGMAASSIASPNGQPSRVSRALTPAPHPTSTPPTPPQPAPQTHDTRTPPPPLPAVTYATGDWPLRPVSENERGCARSCTGQGCLYMTGPPSLSCSSQHTSACAVK